MGRGLLQKAATALRPQLVPQGFLKQTDFVQKIAPKNNWIVAKTIKNYRKPLKKVLYGRSLAGGHWFEPSNFH